MNDTQLLEQVAEAIYRERYGAMGWSLATKRARRHCVAEAAASIEAVRAYHDAKDDARFKAECEADWHVQGSREA